MLCPECHAVSSEEEARCGTCGTPFPDEQVTVTELFAGPGWTAPVTSSQLLHGPAAALQPGAVLAGRYEILELLGEGGMGAVYKARDRELERVVALKVIRPELSSHPGLLRRFKQELILARQITHRNVIRIFDLGIAEGFRFISMELVEGQSLAAVLKEHGKLPPEQAADMMHQVCLGLEAAHAEGVVHRDLKPQNILVDGHGKVTVMDFGIARSMESAVVTQTGSIIGTPAYMSPEQAKGEHVDARSDLFSLGIIFYELLTGVRPFEAETAMGMLLKRVKERAPPPIDLDPTVPRALSDLVTRCLVADAGKRFQTASEPRQEIEAWMETRPGAAGAQRRPQTRQQSRAWRWLTAGVAVLALFLAGLLMREYLVHRAAPAQKAVTVLMADFSNTTSDPLFNGTLEPSLSLALEGARFITTFDRLEVRRIAAELRPGTTGVDEALARLVAIRQGIDAVVAGSIAGKGSGYLVSVRLVDAVTGKLLVQKELEITNKEGVLAAVGKVAAPIRKTLGDTTPESAQLAAAETFTSSSLEAAHAYGEAQQLGWKGRWDEAIRSYLRAAELEPGLGRAYAGVAAAYANQGLRQEAEKYYQLAMARLDRMTDREKYRTRGGYYLMVRNHQKAIEEFSALVGQYPFDSAGLTGLSLAYFYGREMERALKEGRQALALYPHSVLKRINVGLYAMYAGRFQEGERELRKVLEMNSIYAKALLALGLCQLAQGNASQAAESYRRLQGFPGRGKDFAAIGLADLALYEGRLSDAVRILETGISEDLAAKRTTSAASKLVALGSAHATARRTGQAVLAADRATGQSRRDNILYSAARIYLDCGQPTKAAALAEELASRVEPDPRAFAKLILAETRLRAGNPAAAVLLLQEARSVADTWLGRFALGRAYLEAGKLPEAHSELELCLKRRGEATAVFLDDLPTYRFLPAVYYHLGRVQEGMKSAGAAESYRTFLAARQKDEGDPLVADARRRLELLRQ